MKEGLSPGPTFQQGGNNTRKVGNNGLIVLWPASRDTENIRYGLWALPRVSPHAVTHLWWLGRQRPPLYPRGSLPDRWTCPDRWLTPSLSSAGSRPSRIWSRTWWQRRAVTASQERARADFIKPGKKKKSITVSCVLKTLGLIKQTQSTNSENRIKVRANLPDAL